MQIRCWKRHFSFFIKSSDRNGNNIQEVQLENWYCSKSSICMFMCECVFYFFASNIFHLAARVLLQLVFDVFPNRLSSKQYILLVIDIFTIRVSSKQYILSVGWRVKQNQRRGKLDKHSQKDQTHKLHWEALDDSFEPNISKSTEQ